MPVVFGTLMDIGLEPLSDLNPVLLFSPSSPGVIVGGPVFPTKPVEVTPTETGNWSLELASTDDVIPQGTHWRMQVKFRHTSADGAGFTVSDFLPFKLFVPAGGGRVTDLIGEFTPNSLVYVGSDVPNPAKSAFMFQLNSVTGDLFRRDA